MRFAVRSMLLAVVLATTGCASVQKLFNGPNDGHVKKEGTTAGFFFQEENDSIAPGNRDKYYTQGLRWAETINPEKNPAPVKAIDNAVGHLFPQFLHKAIWSSGVSQIMFTPDDITDDFSQPHERPYAGFIYLDNTVRLIERGGDPRTLMTLELQTGTIGHRSGSHWSQGALHALIGSKRPRWVDQLERPLAIEGFYTWNYRCCERLGNWNRYIDALPFAGGAAGNTMVYLNAGSYVRLGWNLSGFFGAAPIQGSFAMGGSERRPTEGFVYVGGQAAFIPWNYFLSQGDFEVNKRVRDLMVGASFRYRSYRLTYNYIHRSREFSHPLAPPFSSHDYGSVVLSYELIID